MLRCISYQFCWCHVTTRTFRYFTTRLVWHINCVVSYRVYALVFSRYIWHSRKTFKWFLIDYAFLFFVFWQQPGLISNRIWFTSSLQCAVDNIPTTRVARKRSVQNFERRVQRTIFVRLYVWGQIAIFWCAFVINIQNDVLWRNICFPTFTEVLLIFRTFLFFPLQR